MTGSKDEVPSITLIIWHILGKWATPLPPIPRRNYGLTRQSTVGLAGPGLWFLPLLTFILPITKEAHFRGLVAWPLSQSNLKGLTLLDSYLELFSKHKDAFFLDFHSSLRSYLVLLVSFPRSSLFCQTQASTVQLKLFNLSVLPKTGQGHHNTKPPAPPCASLSLPRFSPRV